jgi:hypothetical protein
MSGRHRGQARSHMRSVALTNPVGASLLAMNDDAVFDQNSSVLDSEICRESPIDTKNRLAADV